MAKNVAKLSFLSQLATLAIGSGNPVVASETEEMM
jgi:hypothetical protein